jgi:hypothetical protein
MASPSSARTKAVGEIFSSTSLTVEDVEKGPDEKQDSPTQNTSLEENVPDPDLVACGGDTDPNLVG